MSGLVGIGDSGSRNASIGIIQLTPDASHSIPTSPVTPSSPSSKYSKSKMKLYSDTSCPFRGVALSFWDNILGPRVRHLWKVEGTESVTSELLSHVTSQVLSCEICRDPYKCDIDYKFYSLPHKGVIVPAFVFSAKGSHGLAVHSLFVVIRSTELQFYLQIHEVFICCLQRLTGKLRVMLEKNPFEVCMEVFDKYLTDCLHFLARIHTASLANSVKEKSVILTQEIWEKLVHDATTALWCSNKGMSESELVELIGVPSAIWSPFFLSLYESLVNRDGLLNFFHDHLRQAVESKYLSTPEQKKQGYLTLANFFSERETSDRTVEELPFLLTKAGELDRLKSCVRDLEVFKRLSDSEDGSFELVKAWNILGGFTQAEEAYMEEVNALSTETIMSNPDHYFNIFSKLGDFFRELGLIDSAKTVYMTLIKQLEALYSESHGTIVYNPFNHTRKYKCKHPEVIKNLQNLGQVYVQLGEFGKAQSAFKDAISRQNRIETPTQEIQLCEGLLGLSQCEIHQKDMNEAKKQMMRALELASNVLGRKHHFVASIYSKLGQLSYQQSRLEEALVFFLQDLRATRSEFGTHHPSVAIVLNEIALVYDDQNDEKARELYEAALMIILETYGQNFLGTGVIRFNLGTFYIGRNYFAKARYQFEESYKIHVNFLGEDHPDTKTVKEAIAQCN